MSKLNKDDPYKKVRLSREGIASGLFNRFMSIHGYREILALYEQQLEPSQFYRRRRTALKVTVTSAVAN